MNKNRKIRGRAARTPMLSSVGLAVLATLMAGGAQAADATMGSGTGTAAASGYQTVQSVQDTSLPVTATASGQTLAASTDGPQTGATGTVTQNLVGASATGNTFGNSIDLSLTGTSPALAPTEGAASLGVSINSGAISSNADGNTVKASLNGFSGGGVSNTANTISAETTLNRGASSIAGSVPLDYASTTPASATLGYAGAGSIVDAQGSLVVMSAQVGSGASSSAGTGGNRILLNLGSNGTNTVVAAPALDDNTISATLKGNAATGTAGIQAGGAPTFSGSAVVSNLQLNQATGDGVTHSASNSGSSIGAAIGSSGAGTANTLRGTLSVQGNAISSAATGNESLGAAGAAGNRILLDEGVSVAGSGGSGGIASGGGTFSAGNLSAHVAADLAIANDQGNVGVSLASRTEGASVTATVQSINGVISNDGGSVTLSGNSITSAATGNAASSAIASGQNAASFAATAALASQQSNYLGGVTAITGPSLIGAVVGQMNGTNNSSTVAVAGNRSAATAYGNSVGQSLSLEADALLPGGAAAVLTGSQAPDAHGANATGTAIVSSLQGSYASAVNATNEGSAIGATADSVGIAGNTIHGSTFAVGGNTQEAVALSNSATNTLSLSGTSVGSGAGIVSVQSVDGTSPVSAQLLGSTAALDAASRITGSALSLTNNLQRAIGYGNSAANALNLSANSADVPSSAAPASPITLSPNPTATVDAAYGVLSSQSVSADVSATAAAAGGTSNALAVLVENNMANSSVSNMGNAFVAAAYGNDAASAAQLALGTGATTEGFSAVADVTNVQAVTGSNIQASATGGTVVNTRIDGVVRNSSVSTSGNDIQAQAFGNRSTGNTLDVSGNTIATASATPRGVASTNGSVLTTDASFSVQNAQSGSGTVTATQRDGEPGDGSAASVRVSFGRSVGSSAIAASNNASDASATSNSAINGLTLAGNALATSSALQNFQTTSASVNALIGQAGTPGSAVHNQGGVTLAVGGSIVGNIDASSLAVSGNTTSGAATGNSATNSVAVAGNMVTAGSGQTVATAGVLENGRGAQADNALSNTQQVTGPAVLASDVDGTFAIDTVPAAAITGSTLSVSDNGQRAGAVANTAVNSLSVTATDLAATSALASRQTSAAAVAASANLELYAPGALASSSVDVSRNQNVSLGVINDATNSLAVNAGSISPVGTAANAQLAAGTATGDHVLNNDQVAASTASSAATTQIYNQDRTASATTGLVDSTATIAGNTTTAEASANRADNTVALNGSALQNASAGLLNTQSSSAAATASAATMADFDLAGATPATAAALNSGIAIDGNSTTALARGNMASNVLNIAAGSGYGVPAATIAGSAPGPSGFGTQATAAVLNTQGNTGNVTATGTASYQVALNSAGAGMAPGATGATMAVTSNSVSAAAYGNSAANTLTVSGASTGHPTAAVGNYQSNGGAIVAAATGVNYGIGIAGATSGSTLRVAGNQVSATAVGNSAVSTIAAAR